MKHAGISVMGSLSIFYIAIVLFLRGNDACELLTAGNLNELGDFLAGVFTPLAFGWLVYLLPVRRFDNQNGFVVADVFAECRLDVPHIRYFIRKVQTYQKTSNSGALFPILMAENFTGGALTEGRKAGLMLTTPKNLFGRHVAAALADLVETLKRAADIASVDGERFYKQASNEQIIYRARDLNPEYPGLVDLPAFQIGRKWCKPKNPRCNKCFMEDICPTAGGPTA